MRARSEFPLKRMALALRFLGFSSFYWLMSSAHAQSVDDLLLLQAQVNQVKKNDVRVWAESDTKIWVNQTDFDALKLTIPKAESKKIGDENYILLISKDLETRIDMDNLALIIQAQAKMLGKQTIDLGQNQAKPLSRQPWLTAFTNYNVTGSYAQGEQNTWRGNTFSSLALGPFVFQNTHSFSSTNGFTQKREFSEMLLDWPSKKIRFSAGDVIPSGGLFSRAGPMLGFQLSRRFELQPEYSPNPTFDYLSAIDSPSTAGLSVDGQLIKTFKVKPGLLDLKNFSYFSGLRKMSLTLTDAAGAKKTIDLPFYFTEQNLHAGVNEFSYTIGRMRQENTDANAPWTYKDLGWSASHRIGVTSFLTLGAYGEKVPDHLLWGARAALTLGRFGSLVGEGAWRKQLNSTAPVKGSAYQIAYQISNGAYAFNAAYLKQTEGFELPSVNAAGISQSTLHDSMNVGASVALGSKQTLSLNISRQRDSKEQTNLFASLSHRWAIRPWLNLQSYVNQRLSASDKQTAFGMQLTYQIGHDWSSNLSYQNSSDVKSTTLQTQYSPNQGRGFSARFGVKNDASAHSQSQTADAFALYRTRYADFSAYAREFHGNSGYSSSASLNLAGGLTFLGGHFYMGRQIGQAFAVVDAAKQPNVRVYQNNQLLGQTNRSGRILVPNLTAYLGQQVRIDDRDIPLDIGLEQVNKYAVPRDGAGVLIEFTGQVTTAISAKLYADYKEQKIPVVGAHLTITADGIEQKTSTGPDGDFYVDGINAGVKYQLHASNKTLQCDASLLLQSRQSALMDLGNIVCEKVKPYE